MIDGSQDGSSRNHLQCLGTCIWLLSGGLIVITSYLFSPGANEQLLPEAIRNAFS